ncbi:MAG TPA: NlpC/P60 family protein [Xanthobacteraceae bacterium]|jgi:cell wall-associated NlpC family hydrolase
MADERKAMRQFDPRVTPARADLAARELYGKVAAPHYAEGNVYEVIAPQTPLRGEPRPDALLATEALRGDRVTVYDINAEGWAWGQLAADGYVGWLATSALAPAGQQPTHKVTALRTLVFPGPSIKLPPLEALPFGARLVICETKDQMAITPARGYVPAVHLAPVAYDETDFVAVAERFAGAPYLWGGKTVLGIDCSGLVQVALAACGVASPRDSDMQEEALGAPVEIAAALASPQRGDLIFWEGHVAVVRDQTSLIHASAFHMAVAIEPIVEAVGRIRAGGTEISRMRRLAA